MATSKIRNCGQFLRTQSQIYHYATRAYCSSEVSRQTVRKWSQRIKTTQWRWPDSYKADRVHSMQSLLNSIVKGSKANESITYDCHFAFNTQTNESLGSDGYDNYQAPLGSNGEELFLRRMWVNGSLEYADGSPALNQKLDCVETISSVKHLSANVFVKIARVFTDFATQLPVMQETRTIMYTNSPFRVNSSPRHSPLDATGQSCVCSVSLEQQARFNALTANLHKIHYSLEHCKQENLRQVVVSGPLLVSIMLHYFSSCYPGAVIKNLRYRNSEPCFVDDVFLISITEAAKSYSIAISRQGSVLCEGSLTVQ